MEQKANEIYAVLIKFGACPSKIVSFVRRWMADENFKFYWDDYVYSRKTNETDSEEINELLKLIKWVNTKLK